MKIDQEELSPIEKLIDPQADWSNVEEESLITIGEEIVRHKKNAHVILGRLALVQAKLTKHSTLRDFAKEIGIGEKTLSVYKSVEKRLEGLEIPQDLSWKSRQLIAFSKDPKGVLKHILDEGLTNSMVIRMLYKPEETHKTIICPKCKTELEVK